MLERTSLSMGIFDTPYGGPSMKLACQKVVMLRDAFRATNFWKSFMP